jgi:hypothetical protein
VLLPNGTYRFIVVCGTVEFSVAISYPDVPSWTSAAIPVGTSSCVVSESVPLPPVVVTPAVPGAPATLAALWQDPFFYLSSPAPANLLAGTGYSRTVPLNPSGKTTVIVANRFS